MIMNKPLAGLINLNVISYNSDLKISLLKFRYDLNLDQFTDDDLDKFSKMSLLSIYNEIIQKYINKR